jgi:AdoMet-dependent rRNA methyltransferase SPB1
VRACPSHTQRELVDGAYNKWAWNDPELPAWFHDEEASHRVLNLPVTREMADDIKARNREINARPIKKVGPPFLLNAFCFSVYMRE